MLGYFFLNEIITKLKLLSILMILGSLIFLLITLNTLPLLAILIGITWSVYGLLKKQINVSSEIRLLYESGLISFIVVPYLIYLNLKGTGFFFRSYIFHFNFININQSHDNFSTFLLYFRIKIYSTRICRNCFF